MLANRPTEILEHKSFNQQTRQQQKDKENFINQNQQIKQAQLTEISNPSNLNLIKNSNQGRVLFIEGLNHFEGGRNTPVQMKSHINKSAISNRSLNVSGPNKKQRKVDSQSEDEIDEEEFQEYFQNPQKRKEFDNQRLQQQVREIQGISGFNLGNFAGKSMKEIRQSYPTEIKEPVILNQQSQKNYATVSLCCLSVTNPFRIKVISLTLENPWFDRFFLLVIISNSLILAMDNEVDIVTNNATILDMIFLCLYSVEMLLKIIAMGFVMRPFSYLRDPWNFLDFIVISLGWLANFLSSSNISSIRVIRLLRPLKTINSMPGMSSLVTTILNSLPFMFDILVLFAFFLLILGVVGTQILGGTLRFRCMALNLNGTNSIYIGVNKTELYCQSNTDCTAQFPDVKNISCVDYGNPISGTYNFDDVLSSIFNIFQMITLENWSTMMYLVRNSTKTRMYDVFFLIIVIFGSFIVLNLMIAVQVQNLSESFDQIDQKNLIISELKKDEEEVSQQDQVNGFEQEQTVEQDEGTEGEEGDGKKKGFCSFKRNKQLEKFRMQVFEITADPSGMFAKIMMFFIVLNTAFLATEYYEKPDWITITQFYGNYVFTIIFFIEVIIKFFAYGIIDYFKDNFNCFDLVVVVFSMYDTFSPGEANGYSVFRAFRLLSIFKIMKSWTDLRKLLETIFESLPDIGNLCFLMTLYLFIFSLLGKQFFQFQLYDTGTGDISRYDFQTAQAALITTFCLLCEDNWNEIMIEVYNQYGSLVLPTIYFFSAVIIGCNILINLFLAILVRFFERDDKEDDVPEIQKLPSTPPLKSIESKVSQQEVDEIKVDQQEIQQSSFNSANSNIQDEFERIKNQLQNISNIVVVQDQIKKENKLKKKKSNDISNQGNNSKVKSKNQQGSINKSANSPQRQGENDLSNIKSVDLSKFEEDKDQTKNEKPLDRKITFTDQGLNKSLRKSKTRIIEIDEEGRSLFLLAQDNQFRQLLKSLVENPTFEDFIYHIIGFNSILLILDAPVLTDPYQNYTINMLQNVISGIFIAEFFIKVIVQGFFIGKKSYLRDEWNILDFVIVVFTIITWILSSLQSFDLSFAKGFRALRALRPLKMVSKNEGIKTVVNAILSAIPSLMNVTLIVGLIMLIFAILGVQLMKGQLGFCNDSDPSIQLKTDCVGFFMKPVFNEVNVQVTIQKTDRVWSVPFSNYDNIFISMITFFIVSTRENWGIKMFNAMDSVGYDTVQKKNNRPVFCLIYISFILITSFFVLNLFISVIVNKFNLEIKKRQGSDNFSHEQKEWVKLQRLLCLTEPKIIPVEPINCLRLQCFKIVQSQAFEYLVMFFIIANTVFLCVDFYGKDEFYARVLYISNIAFLGFFTLEAILKMIAYGITYYWHVNWNKFDLCIVIMSLIVIDERLLLEININITALRVIRVARLLRMVKSSEGLRSLLKTLYLSLENILTVASLLVLLFFTFSVAGISLFGSMNQEDAFNDDVNFQSFYNSMMTLFRASTGENWDLLMIDCYAQTGLVAIIFWLIFESLTYFIFLNVFIAVVYESFAEIQSSEDENDILSLKKRDIKAFQNTWAKYNPMGELYMRTLKFSDFLRDLPPPLGYQGIRIEQSKINKIIFCLNIKDHLGRIYYPEVMWAIFHSVAGINDEKVTQCEQVINLIKVIKMKYRGLGKKVNLDSLCGNKYYRNDLTASKYIQAMRILASWKNFQTRKRIQRENMDAFQQAERLGSKKIKETQESPNSIHYQKDDKNLQIKDNSNKQLEMKTLELPKTKVQVNLMTERSSNLNYKMKSIGENSFDEEADREERITERR